VANFATDPCYRTALEEYVSRCVGGNRLRAVQLNDNDVSVSIVLSDKDGGPMQRKAQNDPIFSSRETCIEFLCGCAADLFLQAGQMRSTEQLLEHYQY